MARVFEASAVVVACGFDEKSILAVYFSFLEDGLQVFLGVEVELPRAMRLVVFGPADEHAFLLEDAQSYRLQRALLFLEGVSDGT